MGRRTWDVERGDAGTRGRGDVKRKDVGTRRRADKQTTPEICAEFAIHNFRWKRKRKVLCDGEFDSS